MAANTGGAWVAPAHLGGAAAMSWAVLVYPAGLAAAVLVGKLLGRRR